MATTYERYACLRKICLQGAIARKEINQLRTDGEMYGFIERADLCYRLLQDDLSRKIFHARLALDFDRSP